MGSGIFVEHRGFRYLLTAAHVMESMMNKKTFVYVKSILFELGGYGAFVNPLYPELKTREEDPLDLAIWPLPTKLDIYAADINFVNIESYQKGQKSPSSVYQVIGYPGIKNSRFANKTKDKPGEFYSESLKYSVHDIGQDGFPHINYSITHHIAVCLTAKGYKKETNERIKLPDLRGMSGGLLQKVTRYDKPTNEYYDPFPAGMVLGQSISKEAIYSVKFSIIFEWLDFHHDFIRTLPAGFSPSHGLA